MEGAPNHPARKLRRGTLLLSVAFAAGLWILLVSSSINKDEMMVGAACSAATIVFTYFTGRTMGVKFGLRLRDFAECWRIPWYIVADAVTVTLVLIKDLLGLEQPKNLFRVGGFDTSKHDPVRIARTVLAIVYSTCSPNTIVIGIDQTQSRMLFHQIERSEVTTMTKNLGARG